MIKDEELKSFFEFLISNRAANDFTKDLEDYVIDAKHNMQWRAQFMEWERQRTYDFDAGKEAGAAQKAVEDAKNALALNLSVEQVSKITNLPLEKIAEIKQQTGFQSL